MRLDNFSQFFKILKAQDLSWAFFFGAQSMKKAVISIIFLFLAIFVTVVILERDYFFSSSTTIRPDTSSIQTVAQFLDFFEKTELKGFSGAELSYNQKVEARDTVIIHFWASWCEPCVAEIPELLQYAIDNPSYKIFVVSQDETENDIFKFLKSFPSLNSNDFIRVWDNEKRLAKFFNVDRLPMSVVYVPQKSEPQVFRSAVQWKTLNLGTN
jgi:thiol-disulfide isomerase/thioredoxin